MALNWSPIRLKSSWIAVLFPMNVTETFSPFLGTSQEAERALEGIPERLSNISARKREVKVVERSTNIRQSSWSLGRTKKSSSAPPPWEIRGKSCALTLGLSAAHSFIDLSHRNFSPEVRSYSEVLSVSRISGSHHILRIEHLRCEFRNWCSAERLRSGSSERSLRRG